MAYLHAVCVPPSLIVPHNTLRLYCLGALEGEWASAGWCNPRSLLFSHTHAFTHTANPTHPITTHTGVHLIPPLHWRRHPLILNPPLATAPTRSPSFSLSLTVLRFAPLRTAPLRTAPLRFAPPHSLHCSPATARRPSSTTPTATSPTPRPRRSASRYGHPASLSTCVPSFSLLLKVRSSRVALIVPKPPLATASTRSLCSLSVAPLRSAHAPLPQVGSIALGVGFSISEVAPTHLVPDGTTQHVWVVGTGLTGADGVRLLPAASPCAASGALVGMYDAARSSGATASAWAFMVPSAGSAGVHKVNGLCGDYVLWQKAT